MSETLCSGSVTTRLQRIAELARKDRQRAITSVAHVIDATWVREAYRRTRKDGAPGVDGQSAEEFASNLEDNIRALASQLRAGTYRPPPVRRVHIPKGDGRTRPIGVPTFADKVAQRAVAMVLEAIYETEFTDHSYGFRPGRSAHQALAELNRCATFWQSCWVIEADIEAFFDTIDHKQLRSILDQRVRDGVIRRLVDRWLRAGVMENGEVKVVDDGTPQGGVISPVLANIFLHEVLDRWLERDVQPRLRCKATCVRYADDFVVLVFREEEARRVMDVLPKRFARYGLALHPTKTRLLSFNSPALRKERAPRARSFDFLGMTLYWGQSRKTGHWVVKQKTAKARLARALARVSDQCRQMQHHPVRQQHRVLCAILRGHYGYYGVIGNYRALACFALQVRRHWHKRLSRRSNRPMLWESFQLLLKRYPLPEPRITDRRRRANL